MAISILVFTIFGLYMLFTNYKSTYVRWLFLITISLNITIFGLLTYISKYANYYTRLNEGLKSNFVLLTDYQIWVRLFNVNLSAHQLGRLINVSSAIFIYSIMGLSIVYTVKKLNKKVFMMLVLLALPPLEFIIFYDPYISFRLYLVVNNAVSRFADSRIILNIIKGVHLFNYIWINLYFLYALSNITILYIKTKVFIKKNQILFILLELIPVSIMFLLIFIWIPIKEVDIYNYLIRLSFIPTDFKIPYYYFNFLPIIVTVFICTNIYLVIRYQILNTLEKNRQKLLKRSIKAANQNVKVVFHTFKNYFLAIKFLSDKVQNRNIGEEERIEAAKEISSMCEEYMEKINVLHSRLKDVNLNPKEVNLIDIIRSVIKGIIAPPEIKIDFNYKYPNIQAYIDGFHFVEALRNIIINAIEAVKYKDNNDGIVAISITAEEDWAIIQISDNGVGIEKEHLKNIFRPFFTTKNTKNNWGVGLSYTQTVIIGHGGCIDVKSQSESGTQFEITIPIEGVEWYEQSRANKGSHSRRYETYKRAL